MQSCRSRDTFEADARQRISRPRIFLFGRKIYYMSLINTIPCTLPAGAVDPEPRRAVSPGVDQGRLILVFTV